MFHRFVCLAAVAIAVPVLADVPAPVGQVTLPGPGNGNTFTVSARYSADGQLYVWDGANILYETTPGARPFTILSPGGIGSGSADTAAINFTSDGSTVVVGNGAGGLAGAIDPSDPSNGLIFTIPIGGGTSHQSADVNDHVDFIPLPSISTLANAHQKMLVDEGAPGLTSAVSIVDLTSGANTAIITSIPGAGTSLAMDGANRLYVGIGYDGKTTGSHRGDIRRFDWTAVETAFLNHTPLDWTAGQLFNSPTNNNSGAGMFFDSRGYLFVGGNEGVAVFAPDGTGQVYDLGLGYVTLTYNPAADQFFAKPFSGDTLNVYNAAAFVPEPAALLLPALAALGLLRRRRAGARRTA
ncbi:MAG: PEP-CTERM sorting domain-containing protein [Tepidisphaerales bacterium]